MTPKWRLQFLLFILLTNYFIHYRVFIILYVSKHLYNLSMKNIELIMNPLLTKTQKADCEYSMSWKTNSYYLLQTNDFDSFKEGVYWCGKNGNVLRTIERNHFEEFAKYIFDNKQSIIDGIFVISKIKRFGRSHPFSLASKVCHIISPINYPLIYDELVRRAFGVRTINEYERLILECRKKVVGKKNQDVYLLDSKIWASMI